MIKKIIIAMLSGLVMFGMFVGISQYEYNKGVYTINAKVVQKNQSGYTVVEDEDGYLWCMYTRGDSLEKEEKIELKMHDNKTEKITDDKILEYKVIK